MTREFFNVRFMALVKAFLYAEKNIDPRTQDIYWEMLQDLDEDDFDDGVRVCLATCKFFPTIAELGKSSMPSEPKIARIMTKNGMDNVCVGEISWEQQLRDVRKKRQIGAEVKGLLK